MKENASPNIAELYEHFKNKNANTVPEDKTKHVMDIAFNRRHIISQISNDGIKMYFEIK